MLYDSMLDSSLDNAVEFYLSCFGFEFAQIIYMWYMHTNLEALKAYEKYFFLHFKIIKLISILFNLKN